MPGYLVTDGDGKPVRQFVSYDNKNFNIISYYTDGTESYREVYPPQTGEPYQFRWLGPNGTKWGLDMPDCLYLFAPVRGDATYRIHGERGSANHFDVQVNFGHFASGDIGSWGTISSRHGGELGIRVTHRPRFGLRRAGSRIAAAGGRARGATARVPCACGNAAIARPYQFLLRLLVHFPLPA